MSLLDKFIASRYNLVRGKYTPNIRITPNSSRLDIDGFPASYDPSKSRLSKLDSKFNIDKTPSKYKP